MNEPIWPSAEELATDLLSDPQAAHARVTGELQTLMFDKINLAMEAVGYQEEGAVRARRWKECAKKMRRIARMLGRRSDLVEKRAQLAERRVELVRRWARVHVMTTEQRASLRAALEGQD